MTKTTTNVTDTAEQLTITIDATDNDSLAQAVYQGLTTPELLMEWIDASKIKLDTEMIDDCLVVGDSVYADDGNAEIEYHGMTGEEAAAEYVADGDWGDATETSWITVRTWRNGIDSDGDIVPVDEESHTVTIEANEPECVDGHDHQWDECGVQGHGGGVVCTDRCIICGCRKVTDTWAQNPENGVQGLTSVEYTEGEYTDEVNAAHIQRAKDALETVETEQTGEYAFEWLDEDGDQVGADDDDLCEYGIALLVDADAAKITGSAISTADDDE